jgi:hypothetical protein
MSSASNSRGEAPFSFFQTVTYNVVWAIAEPYLSSEEVIGADTKLIQG